MRAKRTPLSGNFGSRFLYTKRSVPILSDVQRRNQLCGSAFGGWVCRLARKPVRRKGRAFGAVLPDVLFAWVGLPLSQRSPLWNLSSATFFADCVGQPTQKPMVRIGVSSVAAAHVGPHSGVSFSGLTADGSSFGEQT